MKPIPIKLKGSNFTLFVLYIYNSQPEIIYQAIKYKINQAPKLFKNAPVVLNISHITSIIDWKEIKYLISLTGLKIIGVTGCKNNNLKYEILKTGIPILPCNKDAIEKNNFYKNIKSNKSKIIDKQIRSGQKIYSDTDLIIINNVNYGAELISKGNIHIYGCMRGRALAGAMGDNSCQIFCSHLYDAELISISGKYWSMEQIPIYLKGKSARFFLKNDFLKVDEIN